jgi:hypothetical protein
MIGLTMIIPGLDAVDYHSGLLTETATVVGSTLIVALGESGATFDALIVIGFANRWVAARSQSYSSIPVR